MLSSKSWDVDEDEDEDVGVENRLRDWRESAGLTLEEVAGLTGLSRSELSRVERGVRGIAPLTRVRVARALGVPLAELFPPPKDPTEVRAS